MYIATSCYAAIVDRVVENYVNTIPSYQVVGMQARGLLPNYEASISTLFGAEVGQRIAQTGVRAVGLYWQFMPESPQQTGRTLRSALSD